MWEMISHPDHYDSHWISYGHLPALNVCIFIDSSATDLQLLMLSVLNILHVYLKYYVNAENLNERFVLH